EIDKANQRISVGVKQISEDPWTNIDKHYKVGDLVTGNVTKLASFGAFVGLRHDIDGLVHISQVNEEHVDKIKNVLKVGQEVPVILRRPADTSYMFGVLPASCRHNETMRDANNTPNQSVAADVSRLKLDRRPARNGRLRNRSDPAHAGCYKREWKSTRATGQGAIAGRTIGVAFKPMLNRYCRPRQQQRFHSKYAGRFLRGATV